MNHSLSLTTLTLSAAPFILASSAAGMANDPPALIRRGAYSSWPIAIVTSTSTTNNGLQVKLAGDQDDPLTAPSAIGPGVAGEPDYSAALKFTLAGTTIPIDIEVDALSSGNAIFPAPSNPDPNLPQDRIVLGSRWFTLSASIQHTGKGKKKSHFRVPFDQGNSAGAEVVTYYLPTTNTTDIPPALAGKTALETSRSHLGLPETSNTDVSAMDYGLAVLNESAGIVPFFGSRDRVFFSVSESFVSTLNAEHFYNDTHNPDFSADPTSSHMSLAPNQPAHAGDIYVVHWHSTQGAWSKPMKYVGWEDLGKDDPLDGSPLYVDVDAIEVNAGTGSVLYSATRADGLESQVMHVQRDVDPSGTSVTPRVAVHDKDGVKVATKLGVRDNTDGDELDALCGIDPHGNNYSPQTELGMPTAQYLPGGEPMGISAARGYDAATSSNKVFLQISGWGAADPFAWTSNVPVGGGSGSPPMFRINIYRTNDSVMSSGDFTAANWTLVHTGLRGGLDHTYELVSPDLGNQNPADQWFYATVSDVKGVKARSMALSIQN